MKQLPAVLPDSDSLPTPAGRYRIETWGCQMNVHDSEKMAAALGSAGYAPAQGDEAPDLVLLNTCSVREKAQEKVFQRVEALAPRKKHGNLLIGVAGCVAQQEGAALLARAPAVDFVLGTQSLVLLPEVVRRLHSGEHGIVETGRHPDNLDIPPEQIERLPGIKAYITIMEGCDNFCSFCVVPFTRGRERCRTVESIVREAESLTGDGFVEIQLLGQNVNSYRDPLDGRSFTRLVDAVGAVPGLRRLRFTSPHPKDFGEDLMERFADQGPLMPHMHLPAQSGSSTVLERMRRGYRREAFVHLVHRARGFVPDLAISTDLIVGFCGETDEEFEDTMSLLDEARFASVYSFKYSERPHTLASRSLPDDVPETRKTQRLQELQARQREIQFALNRERIGTDVEVLVEGTGRLPGQLRGRGPDHRVVNFPGDESLIGCFTTVRITGCGPNSLLGGGAATSAGNSGPPEPVPLPVHPSTAGADEGFPAPASFGR